jgi:hypothetical protein
MCAIAQTRHIRAAIFQPHDFLDRRSPISMRMKPTILPLDPGETLYALRDGQGQFVGTGTQEVCEVLLHVLQRSAQFQTAQSEQKIVRTARPNLRAAMVL